MNIVFVGLAGVPYMKRASDTRLLFFAELLAKLKNNIYIFNRYPVKQSHDINYVVNERIDIIEIFKFRGNLNSLNILVFKILSYPIELIKIIRFNKKTSIDLIHVYSGHFFEFLFYYILAKLIKSKIIYHYVEFRSVINRGSFYHKINGFLCDKYGYMFFDGIICISDFLESHLRSRSYNKPILRIPPICNFDFFDSIIEENNKEDKFLLYCGSSEYSDIVNTIIESYEKSICSIKNIKLILVLNGKEVKIGAYHQLVKNKKNITIFSKLEYIELIRLYKKALLLLIPLRNNLQDKARFPNKICEYAASEGVILTTKFGEVNNYFTDGINSLLADDFSVDEISEKINWAMKNLNKLAEIKKNSYQLGRKYFHIDSYLEDLNSFMDKI